MLKCDFNKIAKEMIASVLLKVCCVFSGHLFLRQDRRKFLYGWGEGRGLSKNIGHHGWPTTKI